MQSGATLEAIRYTRGSMQILDQLLLPQQTVFVPIETVEDVWHGIVDMKIRGAPAIAISAALALAVEASRAQSALQSGAAASGYATPSEAAATLSSKLDYLGTSRPTAVNLHHAVRQLKALVSAKVADLPATFEGSVALLETFIIAAEAMLGNDIKDNENMSEFGSEKLIALSKLSGRLPSEGPSTPRLSVLTHCNTGALATTKFGTALGVIRFLAKKGVLERAYCTETRPYNQGARLTAYELVFEGIPSTLVCDSAVSSLMRDRRIDAVFVGADRVCANGDTANKIGTYQVAIAAKHHGVPFFVVAPSTSIDVSLPAGDGVVIEERSSKEVTHDRKGERVVVDGIGVWNPGFDITPASLITGIVTEVGVIEKAEGSDAFPVAEFLRAHGRLQ